MLRSSPNRYWKASRACHDALNFPSASISSYLLKTRPLLVEIANRCPPIIRRLERHTAVATICVQCLFFCLFGKIAGILPNKPALFLYNCTLAVSNLPPAAGAFQSCANVPQPRAEPAYYRSFEEWMCGGKERPTTLLSKSVSCQQQWVPPPPLTDKISSPIHGRLKILQGLSEGGGC